jgi:4-amino-4-deoxy-L-arabinose transferase-like glycosyltransferase
MARVRHAGPWAVVLLGALGLRLAALRATAGYRPHHDDHSYLMHALALERTGEYPVFHVAGHAVPTAYRAPGFPALLVVARDVLGPGLTAARVAQALVGTAIVALVGVVAAEIWGRRTALVAAALAAVAPVLVLFGASLLSEPLFAALELGALACALHARGRAGWAVAAGVLAGAAALTRPQGLVVAPAIALCAGGRRAGVVVLACAALAIVPWTIRNEDVLHAFVPVSTETGNTLAGTYNDLALRDLSWHDPRLSHLYPRTRAAHRGDEAGMDHALLRDAARFVADHPLFPVRLAGENALRLTGLAGTAWSARSLETVSLPTRSATLLRLGLLALSALAIAGALTAAARRAPPGFWLGAALLALAALLVNAEQRFAVPVMAWVAPLAALPLTRGT